MEFHSKQEFGMSLFDKILWGVLILIVTLATVWGIVIGLPSSIPDVAMKSERISIEALRKDLTSEQNALLTENLTPAAEEGQARSRRAPQSEVFRINRPLLTKLANRTECQQELMNASSEPQEDGSLRIFDIKAGCLLDKVGLQNEDRLKMVDGQPLDFTSMGAVFSSHSNSLAKLQSGQPVVIQIERRGRMVALVIDPTGI